MVVRSVFEHLPAPNRSLDTRASNHSASDASASATENVDGRGMLAQSVRTTATADRRFTLSDDIALAKEVLELNFLDPANWLKIADRLCKLMGRSYRARSVKERLNLILLRFLRDEKKMKSSGTEEEHSELRDLLQQVMDLARDCDYSPPRSTMRLLDKAEADGGKGPKRSPRTSTAATSRGRQPKTNTH
ncbi:hypothetical protein HPB52_005796 [Rhipicephalus sanguineus]|uniref:Uncharacterized protein n=1 Tax=Rhipicephalus sanguineus TaxID=34632 RepID=A0A9D4SXS2_RHISA|nr:hypothetical protein HPB52_005796 [Rhipicephalus sanguineus]